MFRETSTEVAAVVLTLGTLASVARAEPIELAAAQMDQVTAGAFLLFDPNPMTNPQGVAAANPNTLYSIQSQGGTPVLFSSTNGGITYTDPSGITWTTEKVYHSITEGVAIGILSSQNPSGAVQYWDGGYGIPFYLVPTATLPARVSASLTAR
jgi:hypothetical protein